MVTLTIATSKKAFDVAIEVASTIITSSVLKTYYKQLADKFDMITDDNPTKCKVTYKYRRKGSNSGAYWLENIEVL